MSDYRRKAFWEAVERGNNSGMTAGLPRIDSSIAQGYVREIEAENARLRGLLEEAADDIEETVEATYRSMNLYPDQQRRKEQDMNLPRRIRAALEDRSDES